MLAVAVIGEHPDTNSTDVPKRTLWRPGDHQPMRERVAELKSRHKLYCSGAICRMLQCDLTYRIERCDALAMLRFRHCAAWRSSANEGESSRAEEPTLNRQSADRSQWYFFINIITKPFQSYCGGVGGGCSGQKPRQVAAIRWNLSITNIQPEIIMFTLLRIFSMDVE